MSAHQDIQIFFPKELNPVLSVSVTGHTLLIGGFLAYALSKEILVIHDEVLLYCRTL